MQRFQLTTILVTGAGSGLGAATVRRILKAGRCPLRISGPRTLRR